MTRQVQHNDVRVEGSQSTQDEPPTTNGKTNEVPPSFETTTIRITQSRFTILAIQALTILRQAQESVNRQQFIADDIPNLKTPGGDYIGTIAKLLTVGVALSSCWGSFNYLNDVISAGLNAKVDQIALLAIPLVNWKFSGGRSTLVLAAGVMGASLFLPFSVAAAAGSSIGLGLCLYNFMEELQRRSLSPFTSSLDPSSARFLNLSNDLEGATLNGFLKALGSLLSGKTYQFNHKAQRFDSIHSFTMIPAAWAAVGLIIYSMMGTVVGTVTPLLEAPGISKAKKKTGTDALAAINQHVQDLEQNTLHSFQKPLLVAILDELEGDASAPAGRGPTFNNKLDFYRKQTGHQLTEQEIISLKTQEGLDKISSRLPVEYSPMAQVLKSLKTNSGFAEARTNLDPLFNQSLLIQLSTAPAQHQAIAQSAIDGLRSALSTADKNYISESQQVFKREISEPLQTIERESASLYRSGYKAPRMEPPQTAAIQITPPTFRYPTPSEMWQEWVRDSGGGLNGQIVGGLKLACVGAISGFMEVVLLAFNINWLKTRQRLSTSWGSAVVKMTSLLAGQIVRSKDLDDYKYEPMRKALRTQMGAVRYFYRIAVPYTVAIWLLGVKAKPIDARDYEPSAEQRRSVMGLHHWYHNFTVTTKWALGRQHYAREKQVNEARLQFESVIKTMGGIITALGASPNIKTADDIRIAQDAVFQLLLKRADRGYTPLKQRFLEAFFRGEAPDQIACNFKGKTTMLSYYQVRELSKATREFLDQISSDSQALAQELEGILVRWTTGTKAQQQIGPIEGAFRGWNSVGVYFYDDNDPGKISKRFEL